MLIWVCALHCEAKPVIDYYRLQKSHDDNAFDLYRGDANLCIVSGIGKIASAAACAWIAGRLADEPMPAWINLGIAGTADREIGEVFRLDKVIDADNGQTFYPVAVTASAITGASCLTLSQPDYDYRDDLLFDMEASGFMQTTLRFSSAELTQSLKVISDNRHHHCGRDRQRVSELIAADFETIASQAEALATLQRELARFEPSTDSWQRLLGLKRFTQTQKSRLRILWRYLVHREIDTDALIPDLAALDSAADIIRSLEQMSRRDGKGL